MTLPATYSSNHWLEQPKNGFTLIEVLLVMALTVIIGSFAMRFFSSFMLDNQVVHTSQLLQSALGLARSNAQTNLQDSAWGVRYQSQQLIVFKGSSFAARDANFDQSFTLPDPVSIAGTASEVVFAQYTGIPDTAVTITLQNAGVQQQVTVDQGGLIYE